MCVSHTEANIAAIKVLKSSAGDGCKLKKCLLYWQVGPDFFASGDTITTPCSKKMKSKQAKTT